MEEDKKIMDKEEIREIVTRDEDLLFNGCFSEIIIRSDLTTRRAEKRDFYIESFKCIYRQPPNYFKHNANARYRVS